MARAGVRPLSQLVPDIRAGLSLATERVAYDVTLELKTRGPFWTGEFEANWQVLPGQVPINSDKPSSWSDVGAPYARQITPFDVAPADDRLTGYTIGNRMEYAAIAMDLMPGEDGYRWERAGATAQRDWFEGYLLGGECAATIGIAVSQAMRVAGFTR